jgi:FtsP/CotA-like multicopper oxidase with cupredoxin domain
MEFYIIGSDGGLLRNPEKVKSQLMGPGERLDLLVNFKAVTIGKTIHLVSKKFSEYNVQGRQEFSLMKFNIEQPSSVSFTLPNILSSIASIPASSAVATRTFDISALAGHGGGGGHAINGKMFDMHRVDETVTAGTTEIWEFDNRMGEEIHPMHIHGVQFQILERKGGRGSLIAAEKGWKDTVLVMPGEKVRVIMTFPLYTGVFVFHCHNLEHEDDGMMLNYKIV